MDQRAALRLVYWLVVGCIVLASVSPTGLNGLGAPGYFVTHWDDPPMLAAGIVALAALVWIGWRI